MKQIASRHHARSIFAGTLLSGSCLIISGQAAEQVAAKPPSAAGLINDWLRQEFPAASAWDVGGQFRARYESHVNAGFLPGNDFFKAWTTAPTITSFAPGRMSAGLRRAGSPCSVRDAMRVP